nr:LuxR family transcriptional regulator [Acetobacter persici]
MEHEENKPYSMDGSILQEIESFSRKENFLSTFDKIKEVFPIRNISYVFLSEHPNIKAEDSFISTHSPEWQKLYYEKNFVQHDPAVKAAFNSILPVSWKDLRCKSAKEKQVMNLFREHEPSSSGITLPLRGLRGELGILTITAQETHLIENKANYSRLFSQVGTYVHEWFARQAGLRDEISTPSLSSREKQCLALYADGHMGLKVAEKLGVSEAAVRLYLTSARFKLQTQTTCGAVARAIRLGII